MKYHFSVIEEQDAPLAVAVGTFLDCEHYVFLHRSLLGEFTILEQNDLKTLVRQRINWMGLTMTQIFTLEYLPPGHFRSYGMKASPWWIPSIHHFITTVVDVRYTPHPEKDTTFMRFDVAMEMPFWLYPFRDILRKMMEKMHFLKDKEDLDAIERRAKIYGRGNISMYLAEHQLMLNKDEYVKHFGPQAKAKPAQPASSLHT